MRHLVGIVMVGLLFAACTSESPDPPVQVASVAPSVEDSSSTPSPQETLRTHAACDGLNRPPRGGQITFVRDDRLIGASPDGSVETCLADLSLSEIEAVNEGVSWNPPANRVIVAGRGISRDLTMTRLLTQHLSETAVWSHPTGKSVVFVSRDGRLMKRSSFGGKATDISFLSRHDDVTYHPAGTHLATSGLKKNGEYGLFLSTNLGTEPQLVARGEKARFITRLQFSQDGRDLFYTARHGPTDWHLHRLKMGAEGRLDTLDKAPTDLEFIVDPFSSPYSDVAWASPGDCTAGEPDSLEVRSVLGGSVKIPAELNDNSLRPIGWLPDHRLLVASSPPGCDGSSPEDLYVLGRKRPVLIAEGVGATGAVRVAMLDPPPPPGNEQDVFA